MQHPQAPALRGFASKLLEIPAVSSQWLRFFADLPSLPPRRPFSFYLSIFSFYFYFSLLILTITTSLSLPGLSLRPFPGPKIKKIIKKKREGHFGGGNAWGASSGGGRPAGGCGARGPAGWSHRAPPDPPGIGAAGRTDGWTDRPPGGCTARPAAAEGNPSVKPPLSAPSLPLPGGDPPWRPPRDSAEALQGTRLPARLPQRPGPPAGGLPHLEASRPHCPPPLPLPSAPFPIIIIF